VAGTDGRRMNIAFLDHGQAMTQSNMPKQAARRRKPGGVTAFSK
jgi:hypothetical protein